jgi:hypothetical protein
MSEDEKATVGRLRAQHECGLMGLPPNHKVVSYGNAADALDRIARERDEARVIEAEKDETIRYLLAVRNKAEAEIDRLREALQGLLDVQNGAPLIRDQRKYEAAVEAARAALAPATPPPQKDAAP